MVSTDVRDSEAAIAALEEALGHAHVRMDQLVGMNQRLSALAGSLVHDLRQPLFAVDGFLTLLIRRASELEEEHRDWVERAKAGQERITAIIDSLHRSATDSLVVLVPVDLAELARRVVPPIVADLGDAELVLEDLPTAAGDPSFLTEILENVVQNAGRYRRADQPLVIDIKARPGATSTVLVVTDNGRGLAAEELEVVFEGGRRGSSAAGTDGTGGGLATVRMLAEQMGGDAWAEVAPGGGLQICIRIPTEVAVAH